VLRNFSWTKFRAGREGDNAKVIAKKWKVVKAGKYLAAQRGFWLKFWIL